MRSIPDWMTTTENYIPSDDRDAFASKSLLSVMGVLSRFRTGMPVTGRNFVPSAPVKLFMCILMIALASCSRNMFFTYVMLGILLIHMCTLPSGVLPRVFGTAIGAAGFSALLLIPAMFLGSPHTLLTVSLKVFLSVGLLGVLASTTEWNKITQGLRFYRVPDILIFTFDITLKYIVILGDTCVDMLNALRLRSVGKNREKSKAVSGILGVTFLKSRKMADEMCGAMACRGFEGEYHQGHRSMLKKTDILFVVISAAVLALFIYLQ